MSQWKINPWRLSILGCIIFLMLLIVVLPDVDLPDAAFNGGSAPVVLHSHATTGPAPLHITLACWFPHAGRAIQLHFTRVCPAYGRPNFRPILLRSIRC